MSGEFHSLTEIAFHGREVALKEIFFFTSRIKPYPNPSGLTSQILAPRNQQQNDKATKHESQTLKSRTSILLLHRDTLTDTTTNLEYYQPSIIIILTLNQDMYIYYSTSCPSRGLIEAEKTARIHHA